MPRDAARQPSPSPAPSGTSAPSGPRAPAIHSWAGSPLEFLKRGEAAQQLSPGRCMPCCHGSHCAYCGGQCARRQPSGRGRQDCARPPCVVELCPSEVAGSQAGRLVKLLLLAVGKISLGTRLQSGVEIAAIHLILASWPRGGSGVLVPSAGRTTPGRSPPSGHVSAWLFGPSLGSGPWPRVASRPRPLQRPG